MRRNVKSCEERLKTRTGNAQSSVLGNLVERHAGQEHHHVDDLVHDDPSLEADEEEHATADVDPVLHQQSHDHLAQDLHDVLLPSILGFLFLYNTENSSFRHAIPEHATRMEHSTYQLCWQLLTMPVSSSQI